MNKYLWLIPVICLLASATPAHAGDKDIAINDATIRQAAAIIARKWNVTVIVDDNVNVDYTISMNFTDLTPMKALALLASSPRLALSWDGNKTYFISQLSDESWQVLQNARRQEDIPVRKFRYGNHAITQFNNRSIMHIIAHIASTYQVSIICGRQVAGDEIVQQINLLQSTAEEELKVLSLATGLLVLQAKPNVYFVAKDEADMDRLLHPPQHPHPPVNPWGKTWPWALRPLSATTN